MTDIEKQALELSGGRDLSQLRESMERLARRMKGGANEEDFVLEVSDYGKDYLKNIWNPKPQNCSPVISYAQEMEYSEARLAVGRMVLRRGAEIAAIKGLSNYKIEFSPDQAAVIESLVKWVINDSSSTLPLSKGIWLWGGVGVFKTEIMKIISKFSLTQKVNEKHLSKAFHFVDWSLEYNNSIKQNIEISQGMQYDYRCFDEFLKHTEDKKEFGNTYNPNEDLIARRYPRFNSSGQKSLFVSNFSPDFAAGALSQQAYDRLYAMVTSTQMPGQSKRT
jgi:hypothetical protein